MAYTLIKKRRLYEDIADSLEQMIREGELSEGELLPTERDLVSRFGVGRPAVREALLLLQQRGFVVISNGERARVSHPNAERLTEALTSAANFALRADQGVRRFQSLRKIFEVGIAREVALNRSDDDLKAIAAALAENEAAVGNQKDFGETDVAFHLAIVSALRNPLLDGIHYALSGWLREQRDVSLGVEGAEEGALRFHRRIYRAIADRDSVAAADAMAAHLDEVEQFYWKG